MLRTRSMGLSWRGLLAALAITIAGNALSRLFTNHLRQRIHVEYHSSRRLGFARF